MKKYSEDKFELKSRLTPTEIINRLNDRTLRRKSLAMVHTDKDFIGRINEDSFEIIEPSPFIPYGAACILKGTIVQSSTITLTTTLHKGFRILILIWLIAVTVSTTAFLIIDPARISELLKDIIGTLIGVILLRLFLHVMYVLARNKALAKLKTILEVD